LDEVIGGLKDFERKKKRNLQRRVDLGGGEKYLTGRRKGLVTAKEGT